MQRLPVARGSFSSPTGATARGNCGDRRDHRARSGAARVRPWRGRRDSRLGAEHSFVGRWSCRCIQRQLDLVDLGSPRAGAAPRAVRPRGAGRSGMMREAGAGGAAGLAVGGGGGDEPVASPAGGACRRGGPVKRNLFVPAAPLRVKLPFSVTDACALLLGGVLLGRSVAGGLLAVVALAPGPGLAAR